MVGVRLDDPSSLTVTFFASALLIRKGTSPPVRLAAFTFAKGEPDAPQRAAISYSSPPN
jgi:hypothetical protein